MRTLQILFLAALFSLLAASKREFEDASGTSPPSKRIKLTDFDAFSIAPETVNVDEGASAFVRETILRSQARLLGPFLMHFKETYVFSDYLVSLALADSSSSILHLVVEHL